MITILYLNRKGARHYLWIFDIVFCFVVRTKIQARIVDVADCQNKDKKRKLKVIMLWSWRTESGSLRNCIMWKLKKTCFNGMRFLKDYTNINFLITNQTCIFPFLYNRTIYFLICNGWVGNKNFSSFIIKMYHFIKLSLTHDQILEKTCN